MTTMTSAELSKVADDTVGILEGMLATALRTHDADSVASAMMIGIGAFLTAHLSVEDLMFVVGVGMGVEADPPEQGPLFAHGVAIDDG